MFMAAPCTRAKTWKKPKWVRTDEWVKRWGHTHRAILVIKDDITPCPATSKGVVMITLGDVRQRQASYYIT